MRRETKERWPPSPTSPLLPLHAGSFIFSRSIPSYETHPRSGRRLHLGGCYSATPKCRPELLSLRPAALPLAAISFSSPYSEPNRGGPGRSQAEEHRGEPSRGALGRPEAVVAGADVENSAWERLHRRRLGPLLRRSRRQGAVTMRAGQLLSPHSNACVRIDPCMVLQDCEAKHGAAAWSPRTESRSSAAVPAPVSPRPPPRCLDPRRRGP